MLLHEDAEPEQAPDQEYTYEPEPPEAVEIKLTDWPGVMMFGEATQETFTTWLFGVLTVATQEAEAVWVPEVTVSVAFFTPATE